MRGAGRKPPALTRLRKLLKYPCTGHSTTWNRLLSECSSWRRLMNLRTKSKYGPHASDADKGGRRGYGLS